MIKCNHCGTENADDSVFCEHCGKKIGEKEKPTKSNKKIITIGLAIVGVVVVAVLAVLFWPKGSTKTSPSINTAELYPVQNSDGKYGYIDKNGTMVIEPQFDYANPFSEDLALVKIKRKYGFIDGQGKVVIEPQYDRIDDFHEGLARFTVLGNCGFIDKSGKMVIAPQYSQDSKSFSEGLAAVCKDGKWGYIDKTGKTVIPFQYKNAGSFHEGLAVAYTFDKREDSVTYYRNSTYVPISYRSVYIDKTGKEVFYPENDSYGFSEGLALTGTDLGGYCFLHSYIDKNGNTVIPPFESARYARGFHDGYALVQDYRGYYYFIDKKGNNVFNQKYCYASDFSNGIAIVRYPVNDNKDEFVNGIIDVSGKLVYSCPSSYFDVDNKIINGTACFTWDSDNGTNCVYVNKSGKVLYQWRKEHKTKKIEEILYGEDEEELQEPEPDYFILLD